MDANQRPSHAEKKAANAIYSSFVSGAKFGMIVAFLTLLISHVADHFD